jgi:hypothetical protein
LNNKPMGKSDGIAVLWIGQSVVGLMLPGQLPEWSRSVILLGGVALTALGAFEMIRSRRSVMAARPKDSWRTFADARLQRDIEKLPALEAQLAELQEERKRAEAQLAELQKERDETDAGMAEAIERINMLTTTINGIARSLPGGRTAKGGFTVRGPQPPAPGAT